VLSAIALLASLQAASSAPAAAIASPPPAALRYTIDAELQPASYRLTGRTELTWLRRARAVRELRLQLFLNAWRDARSTWMRRSLAVVPAGARWGGIDIVSISVQTPSGSRDVTAAARVIVPEAGNADDRSVLQVDLPESLGAADPITVRLQWTAIVPSYFGDTGARGRHVFLARWSPELCDVDEDGWICPQADPSGRSLAEPADYRVRLDVPRDWIVGATGRSVARTVQGDRAIHEFHQDAARGFAWTASPDFVDVSVRAPKDSPIDIRLLIQPEHRSQVDRFVRAAETSLVAYGVVARFPYDHLTIVDAPAGTHPGGIGYPALITAAGRWLTSERDGDVEADIARATAQQWWGQLVAIDPGRDGVTDRALAEYSHARVVNALLNRIRQTSAYGFYHRRYFGGFVPWVLASVPLSGPAVDRSIDQSPALAFATLERYVGWSAMQRGLAAYAHQYAYQTVRREQFLTTLAGAIGQDLSWFFRRVFDRPAVFDYAVTRLTTEPQPAGATCPTAPCYHTTVVVRRLGDGEFSGTTEQPIGAYQGGRALTVLVRFADGASAEDRWDGRDRWRAFEYESRAAAVSAEIDPDRTLLLDRRVVNNSITRAPKARRAATLWAARWSVWLQDLLLSWASLV